MVFPEVVVCPICGKRTHLRIQVGGYYSVYPIRVNCINCRALLKGEFVMHSSVKPNGLTMFNAKIEACKTKKYEGQECLKLGDRLVKNADYVAEISGELPCKNVKPYTGYSLSPFMSIAEALDSIEERNTRLRTFSKEMQEWIETKSIAFQLLSEGSIEYIAEALHEKMGEYEYNCDHYLKALHCLQENVLEETKHLFLSPTQDVCILHLLTELSKIDKETLHQLCDSIGGTDSLVRSYRKCIDVFYGFMDIYPFILPAESYLHMIVKIDEVECISSCSFSDIKTFYQDGYESLLSLFYIPVSIDNIIYRMDRNKFNDIYDDANYKKGVHSIKDYRKLDNGTRANKIVDKEIMQGFVDIPANRLLRNGIGHNSVIYDGVTQNISVLEMKKNGKVVFRTNLMNMAIDCLGLAKSSVILSEIILFLLREELRRDRIKTLIHPSFYKGVEPNKKCPCGSGIKYKKCCKNDYESLLYRNMR